LESEEKKEPDGLIAVRTKKKRRSIQKGSSPKRIKRQKGKIDREKQLPITNFLKPKSEVNDDC
jgi:hypothetical protein